MATQVDQFGKELKVGDTVVYYDYTWCQYDKGTVTKLNCPVLWFLFSDVIGVEINGSLTRPCDDIAKVEE